MCQPEPGSHFTDTFQAEIDRVRMKRLLPVEPIV